MNYWGYIHVKNKNLLVGFRLLRISMTHVKCVKSTQPACERVANKSRLRETRLMLKLYYTDLVSYIAKIDF